MTRDESVLVTGAMGCIGAWTVRELIGRGMRVVAFDRSADLRRLQLVMKPEDVAGVKLVIGDLADTSAVEAVVRSEPIAQIIHLGALQLPFCKADPPRGATVNVLGTINVFEAARRCGIEQVVYTSSIAVFGDPISHYGVFKLANEGNARAYWSDSGVASIGLRPMTVYGPGRDQGLTSSPTKAIVAAVLGYRYEITFGGSTLLNFAPDVAQSLVGAAESQPAGARVFNLDGSLVSMAELVSAIEEVVPGSSGLITYRPDPLPFPEAIDTTGLEAINPPPVTPLLDAVARSVDLLGRLRERGGLVPEDHGLALVEGVAVDRPVPAAKQLIP
jgi:UDP-glucuronate 4-epimerase